MKQADLKALEKTLASLSVHLKKYFADQMLGQINSQANTLIDTAKPHLPCPHCGAEHPAKWGCSGIAVEIPIVTRRSMPSQARPWPNYSTATGSSTTFAVCETV